MSKKFYEERIPKFSKPFSLENSTFQMADSLLRMQRRGHKILIHYELDHLLLLDTETITVDRVDCSKQPQFKWTLLDKLVKESASFDN